MDYSQVSLYALTVACVVASLSMILTLLLWKNFNRQLDDVVQMISREIDAKLSMSEERIAKTAKTGSRESVSDGIAHSREMGPRVMGTFGEQLMQSGSTLDIWAETPTVASSTSKECRRIDLAPGLTLIVSQRWPGYVAE